MIEINFETNFECNESVIITFVTSIINHYKKELGNISLIFCDDEYLLKVNQDFLDHDYYTDIITFDYCEDNIISGDLFISIERIADNANNLNLHFDIEFYRVIAHGILHLIGYKDKTESDEIEMRKNEDLMLQLFHVEQ